MKRLVHDKKALIRSMQISKTEIFLFVEGTVNDRFFYDQVFNSILKPSVKDYEFKTAHEIRDSSGGGKQILLNWHQYLDTNNQLSTKLDGKKTVIVFLLDKDIDDIERQMISSQHLIYTDLYHVENYQFVYGDLIRATAAAASIDMKEARRIIVSNKIWLKSACERWKEWVIFCVAARLHRQSGVCNYHNCSEINSPLNGPVCNKKKQKKVDELCEAIGIPPKDATAAIESAARIVNPYYESEQHDKVFKGKWYETILELDVQKMVNGKANTNGLSKRIGTSLAHTIDYQSNWSRHFTDQLENVLKGI